MQFIFNRTSCFAIIFSLVVLQLVWFGVINETSVAVHAFELPHEDNPWTKLPCSHHLHPSELYSLINVRHIQRQCLFNKNNKMLKSSEMKSFISKRFLNFLSDLWDQFGVISVVRAGWALGAYRHAGMIPKDYDADIMLIKPTKIGYSCFHSMLRSLTAKHNMELNQTQIIEDISQEVLSYVDYWPWSLILHRGGDKANLYWHGWKREKLQFGMKMDIMIRSEWIFEDANFKELMQKRWEYNVTDMITNLCRCPFQESEVFCFDSPNMEKYLAIKYGGKYMVVNRTQPSKEYEKRGVLVQERWFFRTRLGKWVVNLFENGVTDWFKWLRDDGSSV